jgi:hypothetical protein
MKPDGQVPQIICYSAKEWLDVQEATHEVEFPLEGLVQGKIDRGFLYQGVLFRLTFSP